MKKILFVLIILCFILSANCYSQWVACNKNLSDLHVLSLSVVDSNLFIGINGGGLFQSTDNGNSWNDITGGIEGSVTYVAAEGTNLYAATDLGNIYLFIKDSMVWIPRNNGLDNHYVNNIIVYGTELFISTFAGGVYSSVDSGKTWITRNNLMTKIYLHFIISSGTRLFVCGEQEIYMSTDYGESWSEILQGITLPYTHILAANDTNVYAGTDGAGVFNFDNKSHIWQNIGLSGEWVQTIIINGKNIFAGTLNGVFVSPDNSATWLNKSEGITDLSIKFIGIIGEYLFAGTASQGVFRSKISDLITSVDKQSINNENFNISPNPANESISIKYPGTETKTINISITNSHGIEVYHSISGSNGNMNINILKLPVGIFFCKIEEGNYSEVKKFVVIR